jgi:hypothetical protein
MHAGSDEPRNLAPRELSRVASSRWGIPVLLGRWGSRLRFPRLLLLMGALFAADLIVPDAIPFIDEIMLGLATALLASLRNERTETGERERS